MCYDKIMRPILFSIFGLNIYSYGFFAALAFIAVYLVMKQIYQKEKISAEDLLEKLFWVFIGGLVLARISYFIIYWQQFDHWWQILYLWQGGLISFGGIIGSLIVFNRLFKDDFKKNLDRLALSFWLGLFFWRIGCTLTGEHETVASSSWFSLDGKAPIIALESLIGLINFVIFYWIYKKKWLQTGYLFYLTIAFYGLIRLIIDAWRVDDVVFGVKTGQFTGLVMLVFGLVVIIGSMLYDKYAKVNK